MRVVVCDHHLAFGESLAWVLAARGVEVVAVVGRLSDIPPILAEKAVDICIVDGGGADASELADTVTRCKQVSDASVVLLAAEVDADIRARAVDVGVAGVAAKGQRLADVVRLLDRVHSGEYVADDSAPRGALPSALPRHRTEAQRLAAFLSPREREVLRSLVRGEDTSTLARSLGMSANTARSHIQSVLTKLGMHSRVAAVRVAVSTGMIDPRTSEWLIDVGRAS
jgi:two-component system, NarL family, nitrate/nitrite response regulator NarL